MFVNHCCYDFVIVTATEHVGVFPLSASAICVPASAPLTPILSALNRTRGGLGETACGGEGRTAGVGTGGRSKPPPNITATANVVVVTSAVAIGAVRRSPRHLQVGSEPGSAEPMTSSAASRQDRKKRTPLTRVSRADNHRHRLLGRHDAGSDPAVLITHRNYKN
ncbi:unnamed protein product [Merluccius merluccius]